MFKADQRYSSVFEKKFFYLLVLCFFGWTLGAQDYKLLNKFNVQNSKISGNFVFDVVQDGHGFIWVATQNGISKFDGKNFFNYTTVDGLPSDEVLQLIIDQQGTLWANCFKQVPSYYDEHRNRFVTLKGNAIEKYCRELIFYSLDYRGLCQINTVFNSFKIDENKRVKFTKYKTIQIDGQTVYLNNHKKIESGESNLILGNNNLIELNLRDAIRLVFFRNCVFSYNGSSIELFCNFKLQPFRYQKKVLKYEQPIKWYRILFDKIYLITEDNYFHCLDFKTLKEIKKIKIPQYINCGFLDNQDRFFGGSQNEGLHIMSNAAFESLNIPPQSCDPNFVTVDSDANKEVLAGNLQGKVLKFKDHQFEVIKLDDHSWIRKNLFFKNKRLTISDNFYWIDFKNKKSILKENTTIIIKKACKINDSLALISTIKGLYVLNIERNQYRLLHFPNERVGEVFSVGSDEYYVLSSSGLYRYNFRKNQYKRIYEKYNFSEAAFDGEFLFVTTFKNELFVFKNQKPRFFIGKSSIFPAHIGKIKAIDKQLWLSGKNGLCLMNYKLKNDVFTYRIQNFNKYDGVTSDQVNDFAPFQNKVVVATNEGLSILPRQIKTFKYDIKPVLVAIKVNNQSKKVAGVYHLKDSEKNVELLFSGLEITGHFRNFSYRINHKKWIDFQGETLNLNLGYGQNKLEVRAVDINGNMSKHRYKMLFVVATPFTKSIWFWTLIGGLIMVILFVFYARWKFIKQQNEYEALLKIEQERNKITADLHDEIGSTLSSLQINSAVAHKYLQKNDLQSAASIMNKVETQAKNIGETIGDIIWSLKPGKNEFMSLSTRIKNFCNEIIGATDIFYTVKIDSKVDYLPLDFSARKNILLLTKEAVNNSVKYSKATQIMVLLTVTDDSISVVVADNGIGFDPDRIGGNGITNIKNRTAELKGLCKIKSSENQGTEINIFIPYPII